MRYMIILYSFSHVWPFRQIWNDISEINKTTFPLIQPDLKKIK